MGTDDNNRISQIDYDFIEPIMAAFEAQFAVTGNIRENSIILLIAGILALPDMDETDSARIVFNAFEVMKSIKGEK
jgi:hypothetical protein